MMMKKLLGLLIILIVQHDIHGQFHAVCIPDDKLSRIKFDGDLSEWNWVPEKYYITSGQMNDILLKSKTNKKEWDCRAFVAWNPVSNWIYLVATVHDNSRNVSNMPPIGNADQNDCIEIIINANNKKDSLGMIKGNYFVLKTYAIAANIVDKYNFGLDIGAPWLLNKPKYYNYGWKIENDTRVIYEIGLSLWDVTNDFSPEFSQRHTSFSNQTIGLAFAINNIDISNKQLAKWTTLCNFLWWSPTGEMSSFTLDPPRENTISWNEIRAILKP